MPYIGILDGETVMPMEVSTDTRVRCPSCEGEMGVKESHRNQGNLIPRHYYHLNGCDCGGESDIHKRMKTLAYYKLKDRFPGETVEYEKHLDPRFADVCVTFDTPTIPYGNGVVVEAQFKHKDKDTGQAQRDFFDHGYSVYWAYLSDFEDMSEMADLKNHRLNTVWPNAVPNIPRGLEGYSEGYQDLQTIEPG